MPARGLDRFASPVFGPDEGAEISRMLDEGRSAEVDERLLHVVHDGVPPSTLWAVARELGRTEAAG